MDQTSNFEYSGPRSTALQWEWLWITVVGLSSVLVLGAFTPLLGSLSLWFLLFLIMRFLLTFRLPVGLSTLAALPLTAAILWTIPQISKPAVKVVASHFALPDVRATPVVVSGDIRIDRVEGRQPSMGGIDFQERCDRTCMWLLLQPGVRSVTVNPVMDLSFQQFRDGTSVIHPMARAFRIRREGTCGDRGLQQMPLRSLSERDDRSARREWFLRAADGACLTADPPLKRFDLLMRSGLWGTPRLPFQLRTPQNRFGFDGGQPPMESPTGKIAAFFAEIRNADGHVIRRRSVRYAYNLEAPLAWSWTRDRWPSFAWQRVPDKAQAAPSDPGEIPIGWMALDRPAATPKAVDRLRREVERRLPGPIQSRDPMSSQVLSIYLDALDDGNPGALDVAFIERLIRSAGPTKNLDTKRWPTIFGLADMARLRVAIARELIARGAANQSRDWMLAGALNERGPASLTTLSREERRLLLDPDYQGLLPGLIRRLPDLGNEGANLLTDITEQNFRAAADWRQPAIEAEESQSYIGEMQQHRRRIIDNALFALCEMGDRAAGVLPRLEMLEKYPAFADLGYQPTSGLLGSWERTLVRLGRPIVAFQTPPGPGSKALFLKKLRESKEGRGRPRC